MFKPCVIIPVYNHEQKVEQVIDGVLSNRLDCIVVDDGSDESCAQLLKSLSESKDAVTRLRLEVNQGKGAAVCHGLLWANEHGYSHALQIDADAQHNLADISRFIEAGKQHPKAVISGVRVYDDDAPAGRRYGRLLTDVWVWINTLSTRVKDSMCGYRLYPLTETCEMLGHTRVGSRMQFDTDILVKLYWSGLSVEQIETPVVYHDDEVSHFDLFKDNVRISLMHTRLFFGMLIRIPRLLKRKRGA